MREDRPADATATRVLGCVHGLHLRVLRVELLQGADAEEFAVVAEADERDGQVEEALDVERMNVLGWAVRISEREVTLQQAPNVRVTRVVNRDLTVRHGRSIR